MTGHPAGVTGRPASTGGRPAGAATVPEPVRRLVRTVLYEGYLLWPYRHSALKNRHRWTLGGLYPEGYATAAGDPWLLRAECLIEAEPAHTVDVTVCFLHAVTRQAAEAPGPQDAGPAGWEEAAERETAVTGPALADLSARPYRTALHVPAGQEATEEAAGPDGEPVTVRRTWQELHGRVEIRAARAAEGVFRLTVEVANTTPWPGGSRDEARRRALLSAHAVLRSAAGRFVSLTDPPAELREAAAACRNTGVWPVLAGPEGDRSTVLASPIILYDHPRIAPESPGDLFDATEIDQLLTLSVLALGEEEQREIRAGDPRAREILDRCVALTPEQLMRLHGALRDVRPLPGGAGTGAGTEARA